MNIINRFTLQSIKKNRVRTFVTIIGIILSTAMFTGVTSIISSFQDFMVDIEIADYGVWEGRISEITQKQAKTLCEDKQITNSTVYTNTGYALLEGCLNPDKPYLCIQTFQKNAEDLVPFKVVQGRCPKNNREILLSQHISDNGGVHYQVGDVLQLNVGKRIAEDGTEKLQCDAYEPGSQEKLAGLAHKEYTVVGICERPEMEAYSAPGYSAFTVADQNDDALSCDVFFQVNNTKEIKSFLKTYKKQFRKESPKMTSEIHNMLLRSQGISTGNTYNALLWGMGAILILIIMAASISLIYNAISISVSERTKDFGLLKSIGATKKQIRKSVLFEAMSLCLIGIPVGIGGGLLGIGVTLHFVEKLLRPFLNVEDSVQLKLSVSLFAIAVAAITAIITVLLSSLIPARRAIKMPAIQALQQTNEICIKGRKLRSSKLTYRLFGLEGMLAKKNFKRNRRKYRMTVFSITISIVLFLSTSCFSNGMLKTADLFSYKDAYDILILMESADLKNTMPEYVKNDIETIQGVDRASFTASKSGLLQLELSQLTKEYQKIALESGSDDYRKKVKSSGKIAIPVYVTYIEDSTYKDYLEKHKLDVSKFMDIENLYPLICDNVISYDENGILMKATIFANKTFHGKFYYYKSKIENFLPEVSDPVNMTLEYDNEGEGEGTEKTMETSCEEGLAEAALAGNQKLTGALPLGVSDNSRTGCLQMILPYSALKILPDGVSRPDAIYFSIAAKNHRKAYQELTQFFQNSNKYRNTTSSSIYDAIQAIEANQAILLIMNIFSYGFIALITLIVVANIFHTVSTNIQLRRKEFASLKSIGMTKKGFNKMMNYECILYGVKGFVYGLPLSCLICWLMCQDMQNAWNISFIDLFPWTGVAIAMVSVFVIVFASMFYSMHKIKKDNPIDALRENI